MRSLENLRDEELLRRLAQLVTQSRGVEADVVAHIGEVERRRLYAQEACSSIFEYCRRVLRLRENEAYLRITVARVAREHPAVLDVLRDGRLHLSGVARLAPHLTPKNFDTVLCRASGMSHREICELVSELEPKPDVAPMIRKLPTRSAPASVATHPASEELGAPRVESDALNTDERLYGGDLDAPGIDDGSKTSTPRLHPPGLLRWIPAPRPAWRGRRRIAARPR